MSYLRIYHNSHYIYISNQANFNKHRHHTNKLVSFKMIKSGMTKTKTVNQWKAIVYPLPNSLYIKCLFKFCYLLKTFREITTTDHIWTNFMPVPGRADQENSTEQPDDIIKNYYYKPGKSHPMIMAIFYHLWMLRTQM